MENMESILTSIKKLLGIPEEYEHFDPDIIMHINTVFTILTQIGVGPSEGFRIEDSFTTWSEFIPSGDPRFDSVKSYMHLKVKMLFDPSLSSVVMESMKQLASELECRLNITSESNESNGEEEIQNG